jgi:hypothetical protein
MSDIKLFKQSVSGPIELIEYKSPTNGPLHDKKTANFNRIKNIATILSSH